MRLWALSDPHLTLSTPSKAMHVFGEIWRDHEARIARQWKERVEPDDVVLVTGDISWASTLDDALTDLEWLHRLPGTKVLLEGNHERWWENVHEVRAALPPSLKAISADHLEIGPWLLYGTRLWETSEIDVDRLIAWKTGTGKPPGARTVSDRERDDRVYERELRRLERCVSNLPTRSWLRRVCLSHHPPLGADLASTRASTLVEGSGARLCVFGHLHSLRPEFTPPADPFGEVRGTRYVLASADYRSFEPVLLDVE